MKHADDTKAANRLVLFTSKDEYDSLCREAQTSNLDVFILGAAQRLEIPYHRVTPGQRSLMKVAFMHVMNASMS